jgi:hypothetical protein
MTMKRLNLCMAVALVSGLLAVGCEKKEEAPAAGAANALNQAAGDAQAAAGGAVDAAKQAVAAAYPLDTCVVSGHKLGSGGMKAVDVKHEGVTVRLCCEGCMDDFKKEPAKYVAMVQAALKGEKPAAPAH